MKDVNSRKSDMAMAHIPALPGMPHYNESGGMDAIVEHIAEVD
jgi:hypothetical protein